MPAETNLHGVLKKYWGYDKFRPLQEDSIRSVLEKRDTLALLPTGGGKSICYQVPALLSEGICLVVSPLIALMKDQVENLISKGIQAIAITSLMNKKETDIALDNCVYGNIKFLYVSPERLGSPLFRARFEKMKLNLLAVDEAHCISQWGYDFRPAYLQIAEIRKLQPDIPVLALTATARPDVILDIKGKLNFGKTHKTFTASFARKNLAYVVQQEEHKNEALLKLVKKSGGSGIVYVRTRKKTKEVAQFLQRKKIQADYYHAGLKPQEREEKQNTWKKGSNTVIVSTNAFGMGIDKADVRFVVHMDLPDSMEAYFQEAGRAGRDGKNAQATILYKEQDKEELEELVTLNFPAINEIKKVYQSLANYYQVAAGAGEGTRYAFEITDFSKQYNLDTRKVFSCLHILEREGYILLSDGIKQSSRVHITANAEDLYRFQLENKKADEFMKLMLRSFAGLFDHYVKINEEVIAKRWGHKKAEVVKMLNQLQARGILNYIPETDQPQLTFLLPRADSKYLHISNENLSFLKKMALERTQAILRYTRSQQPCRSQQLLRYFGENTATPCGICDVCLQSHSERLDDHEFNNISTKIKTCLGKKQYSLKELVDSVGSHPEIKTIKTIQWLLDNDELTYAENGLLKLKKQN